MELTHGSLFSGIGGFDLGFERAGFKSLWQVEIDEYATKVLEKNFPDAQRFRDIRTVGRHNLAVPTVITGGFPCQPFSVAGKQRGKADDRYLWPEMLRVINEVRPRFVVAENVRGIVKMALDQVLSDLEAIGYTTGALIIPACAVDAPHRRDRVWIMGYTASSRCGTGGGNQQGRQVLSPSVRTASENQQAGNGRIVRVSEGSGDDDVADSEHKRPVSMQRQGWTRHEERLSEGSSWTQWATEPNVGRVVNGLPLRVERLKCLGNAIVPAIAEEIAWQIRRMIDA